MKKSIALVTLNSGSHRTAEENLGLGYLASALRQDGFPVVIIDGWLYNMREHEVIQQLRLLPDLLFIGISSYRFALTSLKDFILALRSSGITAPTIAGGYGPTFYGKDFLDTGVDLVLRGEGEKSIVDLANRLQNIDGKVSYLDKSFKIESGQFACNEQRNDLGDLDALAYPARDTIQQTMSMKNPVHISSSRGCFGRCKFCSVSAFANLSSGPNWRARTIDGFVDEIEMLHDEYGATYFKIVDDSFIEPPRDATWAYLFANELAKRNIKIKFRTQIQAACLTDELTDNLVAAGWHATSLGIENWSQSTLKRLNKRATVEDNHRAIDLLKSRGIFTQMGMILFDSQTTMRELSENYSVLRTLDWPVYKGIFSAAYVSAGTQLFDDMNQERLLRSDSLGNYCYQPLDQKTRQMFRALKTWQKHHAKIIEHAVNPISAPKVLPIAGYGAYHAVCMKIQKIDLDIFEALYQLVNKGTKDEFVDTFVADLATERNDGFYLVDHELMRLDSIYGLQFDVIDNPFNEEV